MKGIKHVACSHNIFSCALHELYMRAYITTLSEKAKEKKKEKKNKHISSAFHYIAEANK